MAILMALPMVIPTAIPMPIHITYPYNYVIRYSCRRPSCNATCQPHRCGGGPYCKRDPHSFRVFHIWRQHTASFYRMQITLDRCKARETTFRASHHTKHCLLAHGCEFCVCFILQVSVETYSQCPYMLRPSFNRPRDFPTMTLQCQAVSLVQIVQILALVPFWGFASRVFPTMTLQCQAVSLVQIVQILALVPFCGFAWSP
jgi:hypothetical protein